MIGITQAYCQDLSPLATISPFQCTSENFRLQYTPCEEVIFCSVDKLHLSYIWYCILITDHLKATYLLYDTKWHFRHCVTTYCYLNIMVRLLSRTITLNNILLLVIKPLATPAGGIFDFTLKGTEVPETLSIQG